MNTYYPSFDQEILNPKYGMDGVVSLLTEYLPRGSSIFDLGAGHGRNSIPLAKMGYRVYAHDLSITHLRTQSLLENLGIITLEGDIVQYNFDEIHDAFICMRVLHFLEISKARGIIQNMQDHTKSGGFHALTFFTSESDPVVSLVPKDWYFPDVQEVQDLYREWSILSFSAPKIHEPSESTRWRKMVSVSCLFQKL